MGQNLAVTLSHTAYKQRVYSDAAWTNSFSHNNFGIVTPPSNNFNTTVILHIESIRNVTPPNKSLSWLCSKVGPHARNVSQKLLALRPTIANDSDFKSLYELILAIESLAENMSPWSDAEIREEIAQARAAIIQDFQWAEVILLKVEARVASAPTEPTEKEVADIFKAIKKLWSETEIREALDQLSPVVEHLRLWNSKKRAHKLI